jgi:biofilm PGA synthesis N-glycosyltransferase PgaC
MRSYDNASQRLLVISPVKDEAQYIERTIRSMVAQTHRPVRWVIVDDDSTDATGAIADAAAGAHPWITVIHRQKGMTRRVGPRVIEAFNVGLRQADAEAYDFLCKLDGDLEFEPGYFAALLSRFATDHRLGTISGKAQSPARDGFVLERTSD